MSTGLTPSRRVEGRRLRPAEPLSHEVYDRQARVPGFDQAALNRAWGDVIGAGGLGSEIGEGLVRKGIGGLRLFDHDTVELHNLNRQLFFEDDVGHPKPSRLAPNLAAHATCGTVLEAYDMSIQDAVALGFRSDADFGVCGIDNDAGRVFGSAYYGKFGTPVVFLAVDAVAESGHVFVQEPGEACFVCAFPDAVSNSVHPCLTPAVKDVLKVVAGLALYAIDTLLMGRKRKWNYRRVHLAGFVPDIQEAIPRNSTCPICGRTDATQ